jgi:ElaB/YqjD/DUF883 family membrane-anchored ribosome-binding protein
LEAARKATADAKAQTEQAIADLARRAERVVQDGLDRLPGPARDYADFAGEQFEVVQQRLMDRIKEKPVASAAIALGVGLVLGLFLAGRDR